MVSISGSPSFSRHLDKLPGSEDGDCAEQCQTIPGRQRNSSAQSHQVHTWEQRSGQRHCAEQREHYQSVCSPAMDPPQPDHRGDNESEPDHADGESRRFRCAHDPDCQPPVSSEPDEKEHRQDLADLSTIHLDPLRESHFGRRGLARAAMSHAHIFRKRRFPGNYVRGVDLPEFDDGGITRKDFSGRSSRDREQHLATGAATLQRTMRLGSLLQRIFGADAH